MDDTWNIQYRDLHRLAQGKLPVAITLRSGVKISGRVLDVTDWVLIQCDIAWQGDTDKRWRTTHARVDVAQIAAYAYEDFQTLPDDE